MKSKTILIVDDTVLNIDILSEALDEYDIIETTNGKDAIEIAEEENVDLILLDVMMPELDGFEVCKILKENHNTKDIPIIFITAMIDEDSIAKAYDVGGSDYISKPFKIKELLARVKMQFRLQDLQNELKLLASTDSMTKLYNRRHFFKVSNHIVSSAKRSKEDLFIIMVDIDKFKNINDTYGHGIGDEVIIKLANILHDSQRKSDISCRYGGEEFVMLLTNTSVDGANSVAEKLRKSVETSVIKLENNQELQFTISLGVSQVDVEHDDNLDKAINRADIGLYQSKENGRNRVTDNTFNFQKLG